MKALKSSLTKTLLADPKAREHLHTYIKNMGVYSGKPQLLLTNYVIEPNTDPVNITAEMMRRKIK